MEEIALKPGIIGHIAGFPVTNTFIVSLLVSTTLIGIAVLFSFRRRSVPGKFQSALELVFEALLGLMDSITRDRKRTERFAPIVCTIFFFVLAANLIEIFPGVESIAITYNGHHVPLLRSPSSDLNVTLALAVIAVGAAQFFGLTTLGFLKHVGKYIALKNPITFFVGILEGVSEIAKIISFSFRLFGNIFAGGVLLLVVAGIVPYLAPLPFLGLEIFVGLVQALVFSVLSLVFITMATETSH